MLTIQSLRDDKERIIQALDKRHFDARGAIEEILEWEGKLSHVHRAGIWRPIALA